jgi:nucleotide sugar dehydrogenase
MKVAIFGMGHVGLVTAAMLAEGGHAVAGVDVDRERLESLRLGRLPFNEPELAEIVCAQMAAGRLSFTADGVTAASLCDAALVCVGTPLGDAGAVDLRAVYDVLAVIAQGIIASDEEIVLVIRSTTPPLALDALRAAVERQIPGCYCGFCVNPEFLREGSAVGIICAPCGRDYAHGLPDGDDGEVRLERLARAEGDVCE